MHTYKGGAIGKPEDGFPMILIIIFVAIALGAGYLAYHYDGPGSELKQKVTSFKDWGKGEDLGEKPDCTPFLKGALYRDPFDAEPVWEICTNEMTGAWEWVNLNAELGNINEALDQIEAGLLEVQGIEPAPAEDELIPPLEHFMKEETEALVIDWGGMEHEYPTVSIGLLQPAIDGGERMELIRIETTGGNRLTVHMDGTVTAEGGMQPDEAAKAFWTAMAAGLPWVKERVCMDTGATLE